MQKKLYFLDQDEKNRILNLHESRTKKQYLLNELSPSLSSNRPARSKSRDEKTYPWIEKCRLINASLKKPKITLKSDEIEQLTRQIRDLATNWWINLSQAQADDLKYIFETKIKTKGDYCEINKEYGDNYGRYMEFDLNFAFQDDNSWKNSYQYPVKKLFAQPDTFEDTVTTTTTTTKKEYEDPEPDDDSKHDWYYQTAKKKLEGGDKKDDSSKTDSDSSSSYVAPSGWKSWGTKYDSQILSALGKTGDKLSDDDIKDIYNKLKTAGKIQ
jgi:hypothetical protein